MNEQIKNAFEGYKQLVKVVNNFNEEKYDWKEEIFVEFVMHKIRGYDNRMMNPFNDLTYLELINLIDNYEEE